MEGRSGACGGRNRASKAASSIGSPSKMSLGLGCRRDRHGVIFRHLRAVASFGAARVKRAALASALRVRATAIGS